ncbi:arrestin homolog, partial [Portunus trituberculatus]|uniref:arrestin homolog n=1 Tax=Portunus trituberculatus TaxID=210409 RepID=UPI001E1D0936
KERKCECFSSPFDQRTVLSGKVTAYLINRDFVDHVSHTSPVDGVVVVDNDYLRGRRVFARVAVTYRYGREEDEVMGLHFNKELELVNTQIAPNDGKNEISDVQERLIKSLGTNAYAFSVALPQNAPSSVTIDSGNDMDTQPLGVSYELALCLSGHREDKYRKRNSVTFAVRKILAGWRGCNFRQPQTIVSKGFTTAPGRLTLQISLSQEVYFHGQPLTVTLNINNASKKTVKTVKAQVVQHVEVTMTSNHFSRVVSSLETRKGCPINPGASHTKTFSLTPLVSSNQKRFGIALDGQVKDQEANLASSTVVETGKNVNDTLGIIVSYSLNVRLICGAIGGELTADLPFKLMHSGPAVQEPSLRKTRSCSNFTSQDC